MVDELALPEVAACFELAAPFDSSSRISSGHINDTFAVTVEGGRRYVLQRINTRVFTQPTQLMENIARVTAHLSSKGETSLTLVPTIDGGEWLIDQQGNYWRCYDYIEEATSFDAPEDAEQVYQAALAFGTFQRHLADLPGGPLHETIADFHNTRARFAQFMTAVQKDTAGRVAFAGEEIAFVRERERLTGALLDLHAAGKIPSRVTHNDTKLNNVMLSDATGEAVSVIDLDTVMPGLSLYDFGDIVRSSTCTAAEDERDLSLVGVKPELFFAAVRGYLTGSAGMLNAVEREELVTASKLICLEIGMRFLTDHLSGDNYFKIHREGQNLDRARVQFARVRSIEAQEDELRAIVEKSS